MARAAAAATRIAGSADIIISVAPSKSLACGAGPGNSWKPSPAVNSSRTTATGTTG